MCRSGYALTFGFQAPQCTGGAANFVEARINGVSVWHADSTSALCGVTTDYANQWVDVSQYAGQTVTLSFNSATSNGVSNLMKFWFGKDGFGPYMAKFKASQGRS